MTDLAQLRARLTYLALVLALFLPTQVLAQQRTIYGTDGKPIARSTTDSQGTITLYGSDGRVVSRETTTPSSSTVYDGQSGRVVGKVTRDKR